MVGAILSGIGAAAGLASGLTRKAPTLENIALGADGTQGKGAEASHAYWKNQAQISSVPTLNAMGDVQKAAQGFEKSQLEAANIANRRAQSALAQLKRQNRESGAAAGLSAAQRAGVNQSLVQAGADASTQMAAQNTQTGAQIAGMQSDAARTSEGLRLQDQNNRAQFIPGISWTQKVNDHDEKNRLSHILNTIGETAGGVGGMLGGFSGLLDLFNPKTEVEGEPILQHNKPQAPAGGLSFAPEAQAAMNNGQYAGSLSPQAAGLYMKSGAGMNNMAVPSATELANRLQSQFSRGVTGQQVNSSTPATQIPGNPTSPSFDIMSKGNPFRNVGFDSFGNPGGTMAQELAQRAAMLRNTSLPYTLR